MKSVIAILGAWLLSGVALSAPPQETSQQPLSTPAPPKFLSYQDSDGQYSFGYSGPQSARSEYRTADGLVRGTYSFVDDSGQIRTTEYEAGGTAGGFRIRGTNLPLASANLAGTPQLESNNLYLQQLPQTQQLQQQAIKRGGSVTVQTPEYGIHYSIENANWQQQQQRQQQQPWTVQQQIQQQRLSQQYQHMFSLRNQQQTQLQQQLPHHRAHKHPQQYWTTPQALQQQRQLQLYHQMLHWQNQQALLQHQYQQALLQQQSYITLPQQQTYQRTTLGHAPSGGAQPLQHQNQDWSLRKVQEHQHDLDLQQQLSLGTSQQQQQLKAYDDQQLLEQQQSLAQTQHLTPNWQKLAVPSQYKQANLLQQQDSLGWQSHSLQGEKQILHQQQGLALDTNQYQQQIRPCDSHQQQEKQPLQYLGPEGQGQYHQLQYDYQGQKQQGHNDGAILEQQNHLKVVQPVQAEDRNSNIGVLSETYLPESIHVDERAGSSNAVSLDPEPLAKDSVAPAIAGELKTVAGSTAEEIRSVPETVSNESHSEVQQNLVPQPVVYTPEVMAAREAHFRAYDSAARLAIEADTNPDKLQELLRHEAVPQPAVQQPSVAALTATSVSATQDSSSEKLGTIVVADRRIEELRELAPPFEDQEKPKENTEVSQASVDTNESSKQPKYIAGFDSANTNEKGVDTRLPSFNEFDQTKLKSEITLICGTGLKVKDSEQLKGADQRLQVE